MATRVLVAPDSFKGTFSAQEVAAACAAGLRAAGCEAETCPIADGGEGTMRILVEALGGELVAAAARDPLERPIEAEFGLVRGEGPLQGVVEVAEASGLALLEESERDPELTTTAGTGDLIVAAADRGAARIMVAAGGSATVDGGAEALAAMEVRGIEAAGITVLCDVETSWEHAAEIYGPQKGASVDAVKRLAGRLDEIAEALPRDPRGRPRTGAAGGLAGGLWARGAELAGGAELVLDVIGFDERLDSIDAVISGEGALDAQSFEGKAVGHLAARCRRHEVPVHAIVGRSDLSEAEAAELGLAGVTEASTREQIAAAARELGAGL